MSRFTPKRIARFSILLAMFPLYSACYFASWLIEEHLDPFVSRLNKWARPELYTPRRKAPAPPLAPEWQERTP